MSVIVVGDIGWDGEKNCFSFLYKTQQMKNQESIWCSQS
jgi:hypothetical protein